jgi:hypothetical protein
MARRKRRTPKTSRSPSSSMRRRLALGDTVRVKDAVMDPDYEGYSIGGWSGAIIAFETWEQTPMALIAWDATTQRERIDPQVRQRAVVYLYTADKYYRLTCRPSQEQKDLEERALMTSQRPSHPRCHP